MTRFAIKRSSFWKPLLALFGATEATSWIEVDPTEIRARFGWYRLAIPRDDIAWVRRAHWPFYAGVGWRTSFVGTLGLIGATDPVIRIHLTTPVRSRLLGIPMRVRDLYVSVEDPEGVIAAIEG